MKVKLCIPAAALAAILAGCAQPPGNAPVVAPPAANVAANTAQFHVPIVYNKLDVRAADVQTYEQLADPKLKGRAPASWGAGSASRTGRNDQHRRFNPQ